LLFPPFCIFQLLCFSVSASLGFPKLPWIFLYLPFTILGLPSPCPKEGPWSFQSHCLPSSPPRPDRGPPAEVPAKSPPRGGSLTSQSPRPALPARPDPRRTPRSRPGTLCLGTGGTVVCPSGGHLAHLP
jgi:hypothetical protein